MMTFNWHSFLDLARELAGRDDEAAKRTAISRAYYAAFSLARQLLETEGVNFEAENSVHGQVWETFRNSLMTFGIILALMAKDSVTVATSRITTLSL